jgi:hypothetical protein
MERRYNQQPAAISLSWGQGPSALHVNKLHSLEACVFMVTARHTKALVWQ